MSALKIAGLIVLIVALVVAALMDAAAPASCRDAESQLKDGLITQATKAYTEVLNDEPRSVCAANGLHRVARLRCDHARRLVEHGAVSEASKAFLTLLASEPPEPSATCAVDGMEQIAREKGEIAAKPKGMGGRDEAGE